jgi:hypothetical protein
MIFLYHEKIKNPKNMGSIKTAVFLIFGGFVENCQKYCDDEKIVCNLFVYGF